MYSYIFLAILCCCMTTIQTQTECTDKYKVYPEHSACLTRSPIADTGHINNQEAVKAHNKYRGEAVKDFSATNILLMGWDSEVATVAQRWAEACQFGHDGNFERFIPGRFALGQNILTSEKSLDWGSIVKVWYEEVKYFQYGRKNMDLHKVGHFTQLVWSASYVLGCGYSICGKTHFYVCNYGPSGNHGGDLGKPFEVNGTRCKRAPENGLCDCGEAVCYNNGALNHSTCTCNCLYNNGQSASRCKVQCSTWEDPSTCKSSYTQQKCLRWSNVPFECPDMCKICPYADEAYVEGSTPVEPLVKSNGPSSSVGMKDIQILVLLIQVLLSYLHKSI